MYQGWIDWERDARDRRRVVVRALRDRNKELFSLYDGMNAAMDRLCAEYQTGAEEAPAWLDHTVVRRAKSLYSHLEACHDYR